MDINVNKLQETVEDREAWHAADHAVAESDKTRQMNNSYNKGGKKQQQGKTASSKTVLEKLDSYIQKDQTGQLSQIIHKNNFKMA